MVKFSDYVTETYETWWDVYFGHFALKSLDKLTQPWNVLHHVGEMIKSQNKVPRHSMIRPSNIIQ